MNGSLPRRMSRWLLMVALVAVACGDTTEQETRPPDGVEPDAPATTTALPVTTAPTLPAVEERPWRLVVDEVGGRPYTVSVATSQKATDRMWGYYAFETPRPQLDYASEVLVMFTPSVSPSCPDIVLDDVIIEPDRVYAVYGFPTEYAGCNADASGHTFVVAIDRVALPAAFTIRLAAELVCGGCDDDELAVDLTDPGLDERLWGFARILIVREGPAIEFPEVSMGFVTPSYGLVENWVLGARAAEPSLARIVEPAGGSYILDAGRADCPADDCGDNVPDLIDTCRTFVDAVPGADIWAIYTVDDSGACSWRVEDSYELPPAGPDGP